MRAASLFDEISGEGIERNDDSITSPSPAFAAAIEAGLLDSGMTEHWTATPDATREQILSGIDNVWARALDRVLQPERRINIRGLLSARGVHIHARELLSHQWSARTWKVTSDCYLIVGSSAMRDALYGLAKSLISAWSVSLDSESPGAEGDEKVPGDVVLRLLRANLMHVRLTGDWGRQVDHIPDTGQLWLSATIAEYAEDFVVSHEIAHVLLDHFQDVPPAFFLGAAAGASTGSRGEIDLDRELLADAFAVNSLLSACKDLDELRYCAAGILLALNCLSLLDDAMFWSTPFSHPEGRRRIGAGLAFIRHSLEGAGLGAPEFEKVASFWQDIGRPLSELSEAKYLPPYREPLTASVAAHPRLLLLCQEQFLDELDEAERQLRQTSSVHCARLARIVFPPEVLALLMKVVLDDLRSSDMIDFEEYIEAYQNPDRPTERSFREESLAQATLGEIWFFEIAYPIFFDLIMDGKNAGVTMDSMRSTLAALGHPDAWVATMGILFKLRRGLHIPIPVSQRGLIHLSMIDSQIRSAVVGDLFVAKSLKLTKYEWMFLARKHGDSIMQAYLYWRLNAHRAFSQQDS